MAQLSNMIERSLLFKRKYIEEKESDYFPRDRVIAIYKSNKRVLIYFKNKKEFANYIQNLYFPFFYNKNLEPIFLKYSYSVQKFWDNINYKIIYESPQSEDYLNQNIFQYFHRQIKEEKVKNYLDFCNVYEAYFKNNDKFYNNFNKKIINNLKELRYDYKKIIRFFGPSGCGKSTLIYYFFTLKRFVPLKESDFIPELNEDEENNNIYKLREEIRKKNEIIELYNNNHKKEKLKVNEKIPNFNHQLYKYLKQLKENDDDDDNSNYCEESNSEIENLYKKEFKYTKHDVVNSMRHIYINLDFFLNINDSNYLKYIRKYELQGLFKRYSVFSYCFNSLNSHNIDPKDIFSFVKFIINFMKEINKNTRYFIIIDQINISQLNEIKELEDLVSKDNNCRIIEIFKNKNIGDFLYKNIIDDKEKTFHNLIMYGLSYTQVNYSQIYSIPIQNEEFKELFGENMMYYNQFINYNHNKKELIENIKNEIKQKMLDFLPLKKISSVIYIILVKYLNEYSDNTELIKYINFDYFFIDLNESKTKFQLKLVFPILKDIINEFRKIESKDILLTDSFLTAEEFVKRLIVEKTFNEILENMLLRKYKEKFQTILINRIVENKITDLYSMKQIRKLLTKKHIYQELKNKYKNYKLKDKCILFNQIQNIKHYDSCCKIFKKLVILQTAINKTEQSIKELISFYLIDIDFIIKKLKDFSFDCDINEIYSFLVLLDMNCLKDNNNYNQIIQNNQKNNEKMIKIIQNSNFNYIYLTLEGDLLDKNKKKIIDIEDIFLSKYNTYNIYQTNYQLEIVKNQKLINEFLIRLNKSKKIKEIFEKKEIVFYKKYYDGMILDNKNYIYVVIYPNCIEEYNYIKINNFYYDINIKYEICFPKDEKNKKYNKWKKIFIFKSK